MRVWFEECRSWDEAATYPNRTYYQEFPPALPPAADCLAGLRSTEIAKHHMGFALGLTTAAANLGKDALAVLDVGGHSGFHFVQARHLLPRLRWTWTVVDLPRYIAAARAVLGDQPVGFSDDFFAQVWLPHDIIHFGSVLHYVEDWMGMISAANVSNARYVIVNRTNIGEHTRFLRQYIEIDGETLCLPAIEIGTADLIGGLSCYRPVCSWSSELHRVGDRTMVIGGLLFELASRAVHPAVDTVGFGH